MSRKRALYKCEDCAASFDRPSRLANHIRIHTGERPFVCDYEGCDKSYSNSSHLQRHEATHESSHKCPVKDCSVILKTKATLKKHIDNFHERKKPKLYKCTECGKDFNKRNWLQNHLFKEHNGKCPYKCPLEDCGKEFLIPSRLKRHMKTHNGYKCNIPGCEEVFLKWSVYVTHLKQFHPKVHKCHICEKEFSTSTNLKSHLEVHKQSRSVFACDKPNCSRFYFSEKNLIWHVSNYHEARPFVCDVVTCHRAYKTKDALDHHKVCHIKVTRSKKRKPRPSFSAVLSGCADPRKFTKKMPRKRVLSESSDEFTTDEEVTYNEDNSIEESSHMNIEPTEEDIQIDSSQPVYRKLPRKQVRLQCSDEYFCVAAEDTEPPLKDICSRPAGELEGGHELIQTDDIESSLGEYFELGHTRKSAESVLDGNDFNSNERTNLILKTVTSDHQAEVMEDHAAGSNISACTPMHKTYLEDNASSSEYETITVHLLDGYCYKSFSEGDEMSSCLSDADGG